MSMGRTLRLILGALIDLSNGHNVMFVGSSIEDAKRIAVSACRIAKGLGIPCWNVDGDGPHIRYRAYGDDIERRTKDKVHIDHAAAFEKGSVREQSVRSVMSLGSHPDERRPENQRESTSLDELQRLMLSASPAPWQVDTDERDDGADQIVDARAFTVAFMSTPAEDHVRALTEKLSEVEKENRQLREQLRSLANCPGVPGIAGGGVCTGCKNEAEELPTERRRKEIGE